MEPILSVVDSIYPQMKELGLKTSRRVLFDVQGQVFGVSVDLLKQVPCMLSNLTDETKFKNREPDGTVFINRSPKHFAEILNIITNFQTTDQWHIPPSANERNELLQEADFYSLPPEIIEALKTKLTEKDDQTKKQIDELTAQVAALKKELETCHESLGKEIQAKNDCSALVSDSTVHTTGCYVSVSDTPFSLRINKDFSKLLWSGYRSVEKVNVTNYNYGKAVYETRPLGALEASIVLCNNLKSYILCERKAESNMGTRIDLCSMGNGELLVLLETAPRSEALNFYTPPPTSSSPPQVPASPTKSQPSLEERFAMASNIGRMSQPGFQRIVCRFQPDPK